MKPTSEQVRITLEKMRRHMKATGSPYRTIKAYTTMTKRFLFWQMQVWDEISGMPPEKKMGMFISSLANNKSRPISFTTQKAYWSAVLYFYREFKKVKIGKVDAVKAKSQQRIFTLLSIEQAKQLWEALPCSLEENHRLIAKLMFGTGMRIESEVLHLRVKDIMFSEGLIAVQEGKGDKAGFVDLPKTIVPELEAQIAYARKQFELDRSLNRNGVYLPAGLASKYPTYATSWEWYWVFPARHETRDEDGVKRRHHLMVWDVQRAFRDARRVLKLPEYASPHMMRHLYATLYLKNVLKKVRESGLEIPDLFRFCKDLLRKKLRHVSDKTTDIYIHLAMEKNSIADVSPLDLL